MLLDPSTVTMDGDSRPMTADPNIKRSSLSAVASSALWAAWGDALGFPSELVDEQGLQRRLGSRAIETTVAWRRRVGGRMGPTVELPAGSYSDDTQLRLAVARCLRATGRFDVEAFTKIELPVFMSYELGAGRGTKAAAAGLRKRAVRWYSNFFRARHTRYVDGGGNGAAMRIQPHVWAARDHKPDAYLPGVVRDTLSTHGHPIALVGAALHALVLATTLRDGAPPEPGRWSGMVDYLERLHDLVHEDPDLGDRWTSRWQQETADPWAEALTQTLDELRAQVGQAVTAVETADGQEPEATYGMLAERLGGLSPSTRGAGTITAVLALWLTWTFRSEPADGLRVAANAFGTDTDTVATIAGASLGAVVGDEPPGPVADRSLLVADAGRLDRIREGAPAESFPHPDPLRWQPPAAISDVLGEIDGRVAVAGLGFAEPVGEPHPGRGRDAALWQWVRVDYGQDLLIKRRAELPQLADSVRLRVRPVASAWVLGETAAETTGRQRTPSDGLPEEPTDGIALLIGHGFEPMLVARLLDHFARGRYGRARSAEFAVLFTEAVLARDAQQPHREVRG